MPRWAAASSCEQPSVSTCFFGAVSCFGGSALFDGCRLCLDLVEFSLNRLERRDHVSQDDLGCCGVHNQEYRVVCGSQETAVGLSLKALTPSATLPWEGKMSPFLTSVVAIVISVALSGLVAWLLDRRKERRSHQRYDSDRKAVIDFLRKLPSLRAQLLSERQIVVDEQKLFEFFDTLGYRRWRISDALSAMHLCKVAPIIGGRGWDVLTDVGFKSYSDADIKQMIQDVQKGIYDYTFENSPSSHKE